MKQSFKFCSILICLSFCLFFIDIKGVDACECKLYWQDEHNGMNLSVEFTNGNAHINGSTFSSSLNTTHPDISTNSVHFDGEKDDLNGDFSSVVNENCSQSACNSANFCRTSGIFTGYKNVISVNSNCAEKNKIKQGSSSKLATHTSRKDRAERNSIDITKIKDWANSSESSRLYNDAGCDIVDPAIIKVLYYIFLIIQVSGIILLVVLTILEFVKLVTLSEETGLIKAFKHTLIRVVCAILLLILPMLIIWILNIINANNYITDGSGNYKIGDDGNPLCKN